jgi:hypothetical protein
VQFVGRVVFDASERERPSAGNRADLPTYPSPATKVAAFTVVGNVASLVSGSRYSSTLAFWSDVVLVKFTKRNRQIAEVATHTILISFVLGNVVYKEPPPA